MRRILCSLALTLALCALAGCRTTATNNDPAAPGRSLADMEAEYAKLHSQYEADCVAGTPEHVRDNQPLCAQERQRMGPLGNEITMREQAEGQRQNR